MTEELIIAGFGGQGVLSMGKILCYSGIVQGQEVTWMPSYGPEMRGGTANVTVILSDERISSPIVGEFDTAIIFSPSIKMSLSTIPILGMTTEPPLIRKSQEFCKWITAVE